MKTRILVTLMMILAPIVPTHAGVGNLIEVSGIIWSFDDSQVSIKDSQGKVWKVPRNSFRKPAALEANSWVTVQVAKQTKKVPAKSQKTTK